VAVLDRRLTSKSYGKVFVQSLPRCRILRTPEEATAFWRMGEEE
jgi:ATP-dependent DNA helicase DinG